MCNTANIYEENGLTIWTILVKVDCPKYIRRLEDLEKPLVLIKKSEENQGEPLILTIGDQADDIFASLTITAEKSKKYDIVKGEFKAYFVVKKNVIYEGARFNIRVQVGKRTVGQFVAPLRDRKSVV